MNSLGAECTDTLMGYLPPVGWADVATKRDLDSIRHDLDGLGRDLDGVRRDIDSVRHDLDRLAMKMDELHRELRTQFYWTMTLMVMLFGAFTAVIKLG